MREQLELQLKSAEDNIDSYRKRFFDKEEESGEIQDLTMQELAKLKHMVRSSSLLELYSSPLPSLPCAP